MDVADIQFIGQWRATCKVAVLWQRFGRAARNKTLTGTAILFAEKEHFDDERAAKEARQRQREETRKRKASTKSSVVSRLPQAKRIRQTETAVSSSNALSLCPSENVEEEESDGEESDYEENGLPSTRHHLSGLAGLQNVMAEATHGRKEFNRPQKRRKRVLEPAMDYLINAENRAGIECRRKVFDVCFENDAAGEKVLSNAVTVTQPLA